MASANTIFKKLLNVKGIVIENSTFYDDSFGVQHLDLKVRPTRYAECRCPVCDRKRPKDGLSVRTDRTWRSLDFGAVIVHLKGYTQRIKCPEHGSIVADVPWVYPEAALPKTLISLSAGLPSIFLRMPYQSICVSTGRPWGTAYPAHSKKLNRIEAAD